MHLISDETAEDSRAASAMEVDPLLDVLADGRDRLGRPVRRRAPVRPPRHRLRRPGPRGRRPTSTRSSPRRVASLRQPGGTALAIVLDPDGFTAARRHRAGSQRRARLRPGAARACRAGRVAVVGAGDDLPSVWGVLSGRHESGGCGMTRGRLADSLIAGAAALAVVAWPSPPCSRPAPGSGRRSAWCLRSSWSASWSGCSPRSWSPSPRPSWSGSPWPPAGSTDAATSGTACPRSTPGARVQPAARRRAARRSRTTPRPPPPPRDHVGHRARDRRRRDPSSTTSR